MGGVSPLVSARVGRRQPSPPSDSGQLVDEAATSYQATGLFRSRMGPKPAVGDAADGGTDA